MNGKLELIVMDTQVHIHKLNTLQREILVLALELLQLVKLQHQQQSYHTNSVTDASNKTDESWLPPLEFDTSIVYDDDDTYSASSNDNRANVRWYLKPDLNSFHSSKQTFDIKLITF